MDILTAETKCFHDDKLSCNICPYNDYKRNQQQAVLPQFASGHWHCVEWHLRYGRCISIITSNNLEKAWPIWSSLSLFEHLTNPIDNAVHYTCRHAVDDDRAPQQENIFAPTPRMKSSACVQLRPVHLYSFRDDSSCKESTYNSS